MKLTKQQINALNRSGRAEYNAKLGNLLNDIVGEFGIESKATGKDIILSDSANTPMFVTKIYGYCKQNDIVSPTEPKQIKVVPRGNLSIAVSNGKDKNQKSSVKVPYELLGLPLETVASTDMDIVAYVGEDERGKPLYWISDEIDSEKKVCIKRIGKIDNAKIVYASSDADNALFRCAKGTNPAYRRIASKITNICSHCKGLPNDSGGANAELGRGPHVSIYSASATDYWYLVLSVQIAGASTESIQKFFAEEEAKGTPFEWYYILDTPIEIPLTDEEIEMYGVLSTYKPTTHISNKVNATLEVSYNADEKTYIDNKFAELQALILEN